MDNWLPVQSSHRFILEQTWEATRQDPAFHGIGFPELKEISAHEGVSVLQRGPGPDGAGNSRYSMHYYNPATGEGDAPSAVGTWFRALARSACDPVFRRTGVAPKAAAWSAHYIADLCVPFHVVGASHATAERLAKEHFYNLEKYVIPADVYGSTGLAYKALKTHAQGFRDELWQYLIEAASEENNWFDPWIVNGRTPLTSSHAQWEVDAYCQHAWVHLPGFHPLWKNPDKGAFEDPWRVQGARAEQFARDVATATRQGADADVADVARPLRKSVSAVYTLWRAAVSGLRPDVAVARGDQPGIFLARASVENRGREPARDVRVRLARATGDGEIAGRTELDCGDLAPGQRWESDQTWPIEGARPTDKIRVEVAGCYRTTPDLQFAMLEKALGEAPAGGPVGRYEGTTQWRKRAKTTTSTLLRDADAARFHSDPTARNWMTHQDSRRAVLEIFPPNARGAFPVKLTEEVRTELDIGPGSLPRISTHDPPIRHEWTGSLFSDGITIYVRLDDHGSLSFRVTNDGRAIVGENTLNEVQETSTYLYQNQVHLSVKRVDGEGRRWMSATGGRCD